MSKKFYLIVITVLLIFSCQSSYKESIKVNYYSSIKSELVDTLKVDSEDLITRLIIKIKGYSNGKFKFYYGNKNDDNFQIIEMNNEFNKVITSEWYEPECVIKIIPNYGVKIDSLSVKFEFR